MKTVRRLYLWDFLSLLSIISAGLSCIFSLIDLTGKFDNYTPGKPISHFVLYSIYNLPRFFLYLLPMSVLICSLYTFSQANRRKEITAIRTAGGRLKHLFYPFILAGVLFSGIAFLTGEFIVPDFSRKAVELRNLIEGKSKKLTFANGKLWLKCRDGSPARVDLFIPEKQIVRGVSIFVKGGDFLKEKIIAEEAVWERGLWVLKKVTRYNIETGEIERLKTLDFTGLDSPDLFSRELRSADEMGISELYHYTKRLRDAGFRNIKLSVDINSKVSFPLINIFMMLLGISLSLRPGIGGGLFSAGLGLLISLLYWLGYTFTLSMGYAGILPAYLAAWIIPIIFGALSIYMFAEIPE